MTYWYQFFTYCRNWYQSHGVKFTKREISSSIRRYGEKNENMCPMYIWTQNKARPRVIACVRNYWQMKLNFDLHEYRSGILSFANKCRALL